MGNLLVGGFISAMGSGPAAAIKGFAAAHEWRACEFARVIVEYPQVYRTSKSRARPKDLVDIALVAGGVAGVTRSPIEFVLPRDWKKNIDPDVMTTRIRDRWVTAEERKRVHLPTPSLAHNVWDAIGIGIWYLRKARIRPDIVGGILGSDVVDPI